MHQTLAAREDTSSRPKVRHRLLGLLAIATVAISLTASGLPASAQPVEEDPYCIDNPQESSCPGNEEVEPPAPEQIERAQYPTAGTVTAGMAIATDDGYWENAWSSEFEWVLDGVVQPVQRAYGDEFGSDFIGGAPFVVPVTAIGKRLVVRIHMGDASNNVWVDEYDLGIVKANSFTKTPAPTVSGTSSVGSTLTAAVGTWSPKPSIAYQWYRNGAPIAGATKQTYVLTTSDANKKINVRTRATASGITAVEKFSAERTVTAAKFTTAPTPAITGTTKVGNTLKVSTGTWAPAPTLSYQWYRNNAAIKGATKSSFTTTSADLNKSLKVRVTGKRNSYPTLTRDSAARKITAGTLSAGSKLTISGFSRAGSTISAAVKAPAGSKATYQWYKNGKKVSKATSKSFKLSTGDIGSSYQVRMSFTRAGYSKLNMSSNTVKIKQPAFSVRSAPKISGTTKSGSVLKTTAGSYSPAPTAFSYQWLRDGKKISKATASSYKLTTSDNGKKISVAVTAKKKGYENRATTSAAVSVPVPPKPLKTVISRDGSYRVGSQIKPGLYKATGTGNSCYWERLDGFSGSLDDINANHFGTANVYVRITSSDVGFKTEDCGSWKEVPATGAKASSISKDGSYRVGIDIKPGLYEGLSSDTCYWATLDGFTGDLEEIIDNDFTSGSVLVDIPSWATGFEKNGCGTLRRIG